MPTCVRCRRQPAAPNRASCAPCASDRREYMRERARTRLAAARCERCGEESTERYCAACLITIEDMSLQRRYGITIREREYLRYAQHGLCACCGAAEALEVDHDHAIGEGRREAVRGLVCRRCNAVLSAVDRGVVRTDRLRKLTYDDLLRAGLYLARPNPFTKEMGNG